MAQTFLYDRYRNPLSLAHGCVGMSCGINSKFRDSNFFRNPFELFVELFPFFTSMNSRQITSNFLEREEEIRTI